MTVVFRHGGLRLYLLGLLEEAPRHGYEVIVELENRFMGAYSPSAGTVYPRLAKLEAEGLIEHEDLAGRKVYRITAAGRTELGEHRGELAEVKAQVTASAAQVTASAAQAARDLRREVTSSAAELREELLAAARGARREKRADSRVGPGRADAGPGSAMSDFAREFARFSKTVLRAAARADAPAIERATLRLGEVAAEFTELLTGG